MNKNSSICIFGGTGLLGGAILRLLSQRGYSKLFYPSSSQVNLLAKEKIDLFLESTHPEYIFMTAGLVGGIMGNKKRQADFLYQNTLMILNLLESIKQKCPKAKLLYTGSTCVYPKIVHQPINEDSFLSNKLEETNQGYAIAKITGIIACQLYREQYGLDTICVMPTNLYGKGDTYDLENGHMIPSLIKKFLIAKKEDLPRVILWGSGNPRREALYSEDCADALIYLMENYSSKEIVNIGTGFDYSIKEIAEIISKEIGFKNKIEYDPSKPEGVFEKRTDISRLKKIYPQFNPRSFQEGLREILNDKKELERIFNN